MPPAKSQKLSPVPHDWLAPEAMVEVTMEDPGLVGSRYPARVLQVRAGKALVEFPAFDEDEKGEAKLKEWVACTLVAPPPPPPGADFVRRIKAGQPLDLWHEDGWWRVTVTGRGADGISVAAEDYGAVRTVDASCLRPRWQFVGAEWQVDDTLRPLLREMLAPAAPAAAAAAAAAAPAAPARSSPAKGAASYVLLPTPSDELPPGWSVELRETATGRRYKVYTKPGAPQCSSLRTAWQAAGGAPPQQERGPAAPVRTKASSPPKAAKPAKKGSKAAASCGAGTGVAAAAPVAPVCGAKRKGRPPKGSPPEGGPAEDGAARPSPAAPNAPASTPGVMASTPALGTPALSTPASRASSASAHAALERAPAPPAAAPPAKVPAVKRGRKIDLSVGGWGELSWEHKLQRVAPAKSEWEADGAEAAVQRLVRAVQEAAASAPLQGSEVDRRLWRGAAAQGWSMQCRDLRATLWCYTAPDGARLLSRSEVFGWQQAHAPPHLKLAGTAEDYAGPGRPPAFRLLSEAQAAPPRQHGAPAEGEGAGEAEGEGEAEGAGEGEELVPVARPPLSLSQGATTHPAAYPPHPRWSQRASPWRRPPARRSSPRAARRARGWWGARSSSGGRASAGAGARSRARTETSTSASTATWPTSSPSTTSTARRRRTCSGAARTTASPAAARPPRGCCCGHSRRRRRRSSSGSRSSSRSS